MSDARRVLVAGVGNVFMADDAFGPEVVAALRGRGLPAGMELVDSGIRGMDLAYRLLDGYDAAVLVDAAPRGGPPGTLYLIDAGRDAVPAGPAGAVPEAHGMDPVKVLALARTLADGDGAAVPRVLVLGCEPQVRMRGDETDVVVGLSAPVRRAVGEAADLLESLAGRLLDPAVPVDDVLSAAAGSPVRSRPSARS
ncbi:hydrogenase maturation protease [Streptomyces sp. HPF1205]|uniref:hydrogenase maturation protease n=1 Tax=Streptomyces sp. HPF1205 TaxID=2873262 RepID=UPI001CECF34A|nr:hydrogenase maturation protease [Streptomyces sp. HPF1205]